MGVCCSEHLEPITLVKKQEYSSEYIIEQQHLMLLVYESKIKNAPNLILENNQLYMKRKL